MSTSIEQLVVEAGLPPEYVADLEPLVSALRELDRGEAPTPSLALAALMASPPRPADPRSRLRLAAAGSAAALLGSLTVTGVAAAANELPEPAQRLVAQLSERYLPFQFPQPREGATQIDDRGTTPDWVAPTDLATDDPTADATTPSDAASSPTDAPTPSAKPSARASENAVAPTEQAAPEEPTPAETPTADGSSGPADTTDPGAAAPEEESRVGSDPPSPPADTPTSPSSDDPAAQSETLPDDATGAIIDDGETPPATGATGP